MLLYANIETGTFLSRPNRFIARVQTERGEEICHVKNTGRCKELLVPGAQVTLAVSDQAQRKTRCDLVAVQKGPLYINMDSQAPNLAAREALPRLFPRADKIQPEVRLGDSRLDFLVEGNGRKTYVEVKGVTLEEGGVAFFPDAPTLRGVKHLKELERCLKLGHDAALLLVVQMKGVTCFRPNDRTHPAFGEALRHARKMGVSLLCYDCIVTPRGMTLDAPLPVDLG